MVLELHVPEGHDWAALGDSATGFLTYALSFVYVGIYWNNHHHMFQVVEQIAGGVLWANLHLLFWLSLFPFSTAWMDETGFAQVPTIAYGINLLLAALAYYTLQLAIFAGGSGPRLQAALGRDLKGKLSPLMYLTGIALSFVAPVAGRRRVRARGAGLAGARPTRRALPRRARARRSRERRPGRDLRRRGVRRPAGHRIGVHQALPLPGLPPGDPAGHAAHGRPGRCCPRRSPRPPPVSTSDGTGTRPAGGRDATPRR